MIQFFNLHNTVKMQVQFARNGENAGATRPHGLGFYSE